MYRDVPPPDPTDAEVVSVRDRLARRTCAYRVAVGVCLKGRWLRLAQTLVDVPDVLVVCERARCTVGHTEERGRREGTPEASPHPYRVLVTELREVRLVALPSDRTLLYSDFSLSSTFQNGI